MNKIVLTVFSFLWIVILTNNTAAQNDEMRDSLDKLLASEIHDTVRIIALLDYGDLYEFSDPDKAKSYYQKAYHVSINLMHNSDKDSYLHKRAKHLKGSCLRYFGYLNSAAGEYSRAIKYFDTALQIYKEIEYIPLQADCYINQGNAYYGLGDYPECVVAYQQALKCSEKEADTVKITRCINNLGVISIYMGNYNEAIRYLGKTIELSWYLNDSVGVGYALNNLSSIYLKTKQYDSAKVYINEALKMNRMTGDYEGLARNLVNLGIVEKNLGNYRKAAKAYEEAFVYNQKRGDKMGMTSVLINQANIYKLEESYYMAISSYMRAIEIADSIHAKNELKDAYFGLSETYASISDFEKAYSTYRNYSKYNDSIYNEENSRIYQEMEARFQNEKKQHEIEMLNNENKLKEEENKRQTYVIYSFILGFFIIVGFLILVLRQYRQKKRANLMLEEQKKIIEEKNRNLEFANSEILQQKEEIQAQADQLVVINRELEKLSIVASETDNSVIIADENGKIEWGNQAFTRLFGYTLDEFILKNGKTLQEISSSDEIHEKLEECFSKKKSIQYTSMAITKKGKSLWLQTTITPVLDKNKNIVKLVAIDSDITAVKEAEAEIVKQRDQITVQKEEITESIEYASYIQRAMLPDENGFRKMFSDYFLLYMPRDIVSGDFYWNTNIGNQSVVVVADCTGHGVPGAFMSMLGVALLNETVIKERILNPGEILNNVRNGVIEALHQTGEEEEAKDGMVMGVVSFVKGEDRFLYAGSKTPLYKLSNGEIYETKGDRMPVSIYFKHDPFNTFEVEISTGDKFYLFSDGIVDQFGGAKGEKFKAAQLKKLLIGSSECTLMDQKQLLVDTFNQWKFIGKENGHEYEQVDDVIVLGFSLL